LYTTHVHPVPTLVHACARTRARMRAHTLMISHAHTHTHSHSLTHTHTHSHTLVERVFMHPSLSDAVVVGGKESGEGGSRRRLPCLRRLPPFLEGWSSSVEPALDTCILLLSGARSRHPGASTLNAKR
jgi:hypothetical protein